MQNKTIDKPETYDESNQNTNALPTASHLPNQHHNHPLSLVSRNFRNIAITNPPNLRPSHIQSPLQHIMTEHPQNDNTFEQIIDQPHTTTFQSQNNHFLTHDEQTNWITPSIKLPPCHLQNPIQIIPLFAFPPPDSPQTNTSSGMNSDTNSDIIVFQTISQFNNSDVETPDEFADSEPSPSTHTQTNSSTFSKTPFRPIQPQNQCTSPYTPSQVAPTYSPFNYERSINNSPDNIQISEELDNFITLKQQLPSPHNLIVRQLSSTITSSNSPTPTPILDNTPSLAQSSTSTETSTSTNRA